MKLLYVITGLLHGGAEVQLTEISKRMKARGHSVAVVSILPEAGYADEIKANGIDVICLDARPGRWTPGALFRLWRIVWGFRPDVVHSLMVHANLLTRVLRPLVPRHVLVNTVLSDKESRASTESSAGRELMYRCTDALSDVTTQVSEASADRYVGVRAVPRKKMRVIPCGVDSRSFRVLDHERRASAEKESVRPDHFRWITVGRLVDVKDHVTAVRALGIVLRSGRPCQLVIRGAGPKQSEVLEAAVESGAADSLTIITERCDIARLLNTADGFVMSSLVEGMPTAVLEAAACSLPIVTTDAGGTREVVLDGVNGFVVQRRDPESLAHAMIRIMDMTPQERHSMGTAGRRLVEERYDFEIVAAEYEALYREFLERKGHRI